MKNNVLKLLAQNAKMRLSSKNYAFCNGKCNYTNEIMQSGVKVLENKIANSQIVYKQLDTSLDKAFEIKVINILDDNKNCTSPLGLLVDNNLFSSLTDDEKQRYIINISEKYKHIKDNYEKTKMYA